MDPERELTPKREATPSSTPMTSIPQKRALAIEEVHTPSVPSPLNPESKPTIPEPPRPSKPQPADDAPPATRDKPVRAKKESLKKREAKGLGSEAAGSNRATPDPKAQEVLPSNCSPLRYKLAPPKPSDFVRPKGPVLTPHHQIPGAGEKVIQFYETSDHVYNKKNYHYVHCMADAAFPASIYRQTESDPDCPRLSFEDAASHVYFDKTGHHITTDKGFRMARANVAIREGRWYWECKVTHGIVKAKKGEPEQSHGHVRIGFARREASLDAPVGFDAYSYAIRDKEGHKVHMSRPKAFFPPGEEICEGDVVGLEIKLPSEQLQRKVMSGDYNPAVDDPDEEPDPWAPTPNIVRDRIPIRFKSNLYYEMIDYHTTKELEDLMNPSPAVAGSSIPPNPNHPVPALRTLPGSYIKVYKNGVLMGTAFEDLLAFLPLASKPQSQPGAREGLDDGMLGYYPSVSVFRMGAAEVNFGPKFWYPPPGYESAGDDVEMTGTENEGGSVLESGGLTGLRSVAHRYVEQVIDDAMYDIMDEIDIWAQKGGSGYERKEVGGESTGMAPGQEEIKELVQDD
ncbi:related to histone-lysine N-methyltransferase [Cephalotrichum gorgonifer]|uniref:Related to histone-lysine N-methyltransferase n=1 Tax=Cephalotrichum gorgonifer TaxID=2041049 RepID=A0AAE8MQE3_9PEZI|nr:related to histone-lysine N-methyltransferase [Cephalotrichum gorgonifer]